MIFDQENLDNNRVLVIDDDEAILSLYRNILTSKKPSENLLGTSKLECSFEVTTVTQGMDGVEAVRQAQADNKPYAAAFIDVRMPPGIDGVEAAKLIREIDQQIYIAIVTAHSDHSLGEICHQVGCEVFLLRKPFSKDEIFQLANALTKLWNRDLKVKRQQALLESKHNYLESIIHSLQDALVVTNVYGVIVQTNHRLTELTGIPSEELLFSHYKTLFVGDSLKCSSVYTVEDDNSASNKLIPISLSKSPLLSVNGNADGEIIVIADMREVVLLEEDRQLRQSKQLHTERLTSMGEMATGIAHEISQPLEIIKVSAAMLKTFFNRVLAKELPTYAKRKNSVEFAVPDEIASQVDRAIKIIRNMQLFSRDDELATTVIDLYQPIENATSFFREQLKSRGISFKEDIVAGLPQVEINSQRVEQIIINLLSNAKHAVEGKNKAHSNSYSMSIELKVTMQNNKVILEVIDNGYGMDTETKDSCTQPFFSTKEGSEGTGLGLSTLGKILSEFGGSLEIESELNLGTTMRVSIPMLQNNAQCVAVETAPQDSKKTCVNKILIVDDEKLTLNLLSYRLDKKGYQVVAAKSVAEALYYLEHSSEYIDLVITDINMPGNDGIELIKISKAQYPELAFIVITGYDQSHSELMELSDQYSIPVMSKPVDIVELDLAIRASYSNS